MKLPKRFMIVDDDRISNMLCEMACRRVSSATEIKTFMDPEEALRFIDDAYLNEQLDTLTVLFLDINMPGISGWEFLEHFKNYSQKIKQQFSIYILTSSIEQQDLERAKEHEFVNSLMAKPLSSESIRNILIAE
ncbi:response regulator [Aequorivita marisscotiae]|uniref:Response regulator n=1 Tax=Aequorivita marisscotiae TaxID=3040348 RepID=A0ABY8KY71_9FLAO|nr:response regulator [Aequorivita sp. Ant34-E75]WGF92766.1 response regulator [Aequorivita sp. Ant34-E75]